MIKATARDIERFMSLVDILPCGCWFFMGARSKGKGNKKPYGSFHTENHGTVRAHRFSSEVFNGDECPPGYDRDHKCKFSLCVNPAHIEVVTKQENQRRKKLCSSLPFFSLYSPSSASTSSSSEASRLRGLSFPKLKVG